jgi:hypothetical protein
MRNRMKPRLELLNLAAPKCAFPMMERHYRYAAVFGTLRTRCGAGVRFCGGGVSRKPWPKKSGGEGIPLLWNHDHEQSLGEHSGGNAAIREDARGLAFECQRQTRPGGMMRWRRCGAAMRRDVLSCFR